MKSGLNVKAWTSLLQAKKYKVSTCIYLYLQPWLWTSQEKIVHLEKQNSLLTFR